nr:uncharacterized mitochondrial protein AtMg00810-like [Tanacetum cinerariifolium]
ASTPIDAEKPLLKDSDGEDVDVHTYRSIIGSLMYLTSSRPDIMFEVCLCVRFQVTPKVSHVNAVKRIFRYLKGKPYLGLWYPKDSPFDLVAYSDSDYAGCYLRNVVIELDVLNILSDALPITTNGVNTPRSDEDRLKLIELMVFLMTKDVCDEFGLNAARLSKFLMSGKYAAEEFEQIIDFLSGSYINHALTVNPYVYIYCIKQFWNTAVVKRSGDVTRLQARVDKKRIVISEEVVCEILQLNDAEGVICLPNEEIFAGLARMGYEKPSTKLTFYKAFFLTQWKFFIHMILHSLSAKRTLWNEFSSAMVSALICLSSGQRFNFSKYIFESLVRNVDSSSKFYIDIVEEIEAQVPAQGDDVQEPAAEEVATDVVSPIPISPSLSSPVIPSSPPHQSPCPPQPQDAEGSSLLFQQVLDTCSALVLRVEGLETDKAAQQLEIVKLKARVKKLENMNKVKSSKLRQLKKVVDQEKDAEVEGRHADKQAEIYNIDLDHSSKVLSMQEDDIEVQEAVEVVTTAKLMTKVVTATATQVVAASTLVLAAKPKTLTITTAPAVSTRRRKGVKFLIHTILQSLSTKRTSWNEFSTSMASAVICLSKGQKFNFSKYIFDSLVRNVDSNSKFYMVGKGFSGVETPLFEGMLAVRQPVEEELVDEQVHVDDAVAAAIEKNVAEDVAHDAIPSPPSHDIPSPSQEPSSPPQTPLQGAEFPTQIQQLVIIKLTAMVKKLEMANKVKSSKLRRLRKVEASKQVESSDDMEDVFNQGRMIDDMDKDEGIELVKDADIAEFEGRHAAAEQAEKQAEIYHIDLNHSSKMLLLLLLHKDPEEELSLKAPAETPKVKDKGKCILVETPKSMKKKDQIEMDAEYARKLHEEINRDKFNKDIDWDAAMDHNTAGYKMDFFKGMTEEIEEEDQEIIKSINKTPAQKAAKRRKLSEEAQEAEDLRKSLEVVDDEDNDVFIEATPLARKVPVVDYQIVLLLELMLSKRSKKNTKCVNAVNEELTAAKHKLMLLVYCC